MSKVSVIIPCYNQGRYIEECVNSVLDQTFQDFEIVIVNDGSTDKFTNKLLKDFNKPKTKVIHTENKGVSAARNKAIHNSSGKYILPLDADDKIEKTYLEKAVRILDNNKDIKLVYCNVKTFGDQNHIWHMPEFKYEKLLLNNLIHIAGIYRKKDFDETGGYDENLKGIEDWDFWLRFLKKDDKVYKIDKPMLFYRKHKNSRQKKINEIQSLAFRHKWEIVKNHINIYSKELPPPQVIYTNYLKSEKNLNNVLKSNSYKIGRLLTSPFRFIKEIYNELHNNKK